MNGSASASGEARRIRAEEINCRLAEVKKLSYCVVKISASLRDFFLGESPGNIKKDEPPRATAGYFCQVKNELDDVHAFLEEALDNLIALGKEIGIDRTKISEHPEQRF
jgi:hypothetical protein